MSPVLSSIGGGTGLGIDIRTYVIGGKQIAAALKAAPERIRLRLIEEYAAIGNEIVAGAKANAPVGKKHRGDSVRLRDAIHFKVDATAASLKLHVTPYTRGQYVAHLIERGVQEQTVKVYQKVYATRLSVKYRDANGKIVWRYRKANRVKRANLRLADRKHHVPAHPFFMPAVQAAGDVGARLQNALNELAESIQGGA